jgi:GTPase Era involved in 16S rRNA processing
LNKHFFLLFFVFHHHFLVSDPQSQSPFSQMSQVSQIFSQMSQDIPEEVDVDADVLPESSVISSSSAVVTPKLGKKGHVVGKKWEVVKTMVAQAVAKQQE